MDMVRTQWNTEAYRAFLRELAGMADEKYREFHSSLVPEHGVILGVPIPKLRALAKEIAQGDWRSYWALCGHESYEEVSLQGFVLGYAVRSYEELLAKLWEYLPKIDNWAICDTVCSSLKLIKKHKEAFLSEIPTLLHDQNPWKVRVGLVLLLDYYVTEDTLADCLRLCDGVSREEYYIRMAQAWLISAAYIKYPAQTEEYLSRCALDDWTYNKALQKARESLRVSGEAKEHLKQMKRKTEK